MDRPPTEPAGHEDRDDDRTEDLAPLGAACLLLATGLAGLAIAVGIWLGMQLVQWECDVINQRPLVEMPGY